MNRLNSILAAGLFAAAGAGITASPSSAANSAPPPTTGTSSMQMNSSSGAQPSKALHRSTAAKHRYTGMSKSRVEKVQKALNDNGAGIAVDGVWGAKTTDALKQFQTAHGIKATGRLDKTTRQQLNLHA
jgi:peptidoglycan DL-endopeptidase CwlO